mmetsp:Transcript_114402/g.324597  ORF Transcript_114402/g.324597 Transcript_114402/m.324597 type:complete len:239 (+) Transcript_114402:1140-1856(+)
MLLFRALRRACIEGARARGGVCDQHRSGCCVFAGDGHCLPDGVPEGVCCGGRRVGDGLETHCPQVLHVAGPPACGGARGLVLGGRGRDRPHLAHAGPGALRLLRLGLPALGHGAEGAPAGAAAPPGADGGQALGVHCHGGPVPASYRGVQVCDLLDLVLPLDGLPLRLPAGAGSRRAGHAQCLSEFGLLGARHADWRGLRRLRGGLHRQLHNVLRSHAGLCLRVGMDLWLHDFAHYAT